MVNQYNPQTDATALWTTTCEQADPTSSIRVFDLATSEMLEAIGPPSHVDAKPMAYVPAVAQALDVDAESPLWPYAFPRLKRVTVVDLPVAVALAMPAPKSVSDALVRLALNGQRVEVRTVEDDFALDLPATTIPLADDGRPFDAALAASLEQGPFQGLVAAGLLLANGQDDASHRVSQSSEGDQDFDYWHGLMHRREPDFGNAGYWFRRVGQHPRYEDLPARIRSAYAALGWDDAPVDWNAMAFLDLCRAALRGGEDLGRVLVQQQVEYASLLEYVESC